MYEELKRFKQQTLEELTIQDKRYKSKLQDELDEVGLLDVYAKAIQPIQGTKTFEESILYMTDKEILSVYKKTALDAWRVIRVASYPPSDELKKRHKQWEIVEKEVSARGYETLSINAFLGIGEWYEPDRAELGEKRDENKQPRFYAQERKETIMQKPANFT